MESNRKSGNWIQICQGHGPKLEVNSLKLEQRAGEFVCSEKNDAEEIPWEFYDADSVATINLYSSALLRATYACTIGRNDVTLH